MKILIATDWYTPSINGVVTSVINLKNELIASGNEVKILTLSETKHSHIDGDTYYIGSTGVGKLYPGARLKTFPCIQIQQELIKWHPDIIHTQCEFSTFNVARKIARATKCHIVHTYHTVYEDYTHYFSPNKKWGHYLVKAFTRHILKQTNYVIAPTDKVRKLLCGYGINGPIAVIPSGIDISSFKIIPNKEWINATKEFLQIPKNNKVLIYVGRLAKEKNVSSLINCISHLKSDVSLLLVGDGPEREFLLEEAKSLSLIENRKVIFAGMVSPSVVASFYHLGDVFISASNSETQGLIYIEALSSGLPVISIKDPCLDGVIFSGYNGWQCNSSEEIEEKVGWIFNNNSILEEMSRNALESSSIFSKELFASKVEAIYKKEIAL